MRNFHVRKNRTFCPTLNVDKIWSLVSDNTREKFANVTTASVDPAENGKVSPFSFCLLFLLFFCGFILVVRGWVFSGGRVLRTPRCAT